MITNSSISEVEPYGVSRIFRSQEVGWAHLKRRVRLPDSPLIGRHGTHDKQVLERSESPYRLKRRHIRRNNTRRAERKPRVSTGPQTIMNIHLILLHRKFNLAARIRNEGISSLDKELKPLRDAMGRDIPNFPINGRAIANLSCKCTPWSVQILMEADAKGMPQLNSVMI